MPRSIAAENSPLVFYRCVVENHRLALLAPSCNMEVLASSDGLPPQQHDHRACQIPCLLFVTRRIAFQASLLKQLLELKCPCLVMSLKLLLLVRIEGDPASNQRVFQTSPGRKEYHSLSLHIRHALYGLPPPWCP